MACCVLCGMLLTDRWVKTKGFFCSKHFPPTEAASFLCATEGVPQWAGSVPVLCDTPELADLKAEVARLRERLALAQPSPLLDIPSFATGGTTATGAVCQHGNLARSCEICERDQEIAALKAELQAEREAHAATREEAEAMRQVVEAAVWLDKLGGMYGIRNLVDSGHEMHAEYRQVLSNFAQAVTEYLDAARQLNDGQINPNRPAPTARLHIDEPCAAADGGEEKGPDHSL